MSQPTERPDDPGRSAGATEVNGADGLLIRAEQTRMLFAAVGPSIAANLLVAAAMAYVQWRVIEPAVVTGWLALLVLVSLLRGTLAVAYARASAESRYRPIWPRAFLAGTIAAGAVWGLGAWLLYPPGEVAHQAFLGVLVAGLTAGAVTSLSASLAATLAFLALSLTPLTVRFLASDQEVPLVLGLLTVLFSGFAALGARGINASILQNLRLRLESSRREASLRASEEQARRLSIVAARTDNAVILTDRAGRIEWVNDGFTRMTGYTLAEVIGKKPGAVLQGPGTDTGVVLRVGDRLRKRQGFQEEILNYTKDGRAYWVEMEVQPVTDATGQVAQFMAIERDVTEARVRQQQLEEARQKAEEATQAKSRFLAVMSHEVRTPLNGVLGSLALLQDTDLDAEQRQYVTTSRRSAEWLLAIINEILDLSKMEAGKLELEPVAFDLRTLVEDIVEMLQPQASAKAIRVVGEVDPALPATVEADAGKIRQVLLNLAGNAVKFTAQGEVRIAVALQEQAGRALRVRLTVSDTGPGIAAEDQDKVFQEFWTRAPQASQGVAGTGLGLPISRRLVQMMGGDIELASQPGAGSRFWFEIPLTAVPAGAVGPDQAPASDRPPEDAQAAGLRLSGHVLLAEDHAVNQMVARALLARLGLEVDVVGNGREAVEAAGTRRYDLILMDIGMPEMDGIAATRAIRAREDPERRVPIVALTAHVMPGDRENLLAQGLDDYLSKPIVRAEMNRCLARWLDPERAAVNRGASARAAP